MFSEDSQTVFSAGNDNTVGYVFIIVINYIIVVIIII